MNVGHGAFQTFPGGKLKGYLPYLHTYIYAYTHTHIHTNADFSNAIRELKCEKHRNFSYQLNQLQRTYGKHIHTYIHSFIHTYIHPIHTYILYIHTYIHTSPTYNKVYIHTYIHTSYTYIQVYRKMTCVCFSKRGTPPPVVSPSTLT